MMLFMNMLYTTTDTLNESINDNADIEQITDNTPPPPKVSIKAITNHEGKQPVIPEDLKRARYDECKSSKISKTGGFCLTARKNTGGNEIVDKPLGNFLANNIFAGKTVVDLGAGLGKNAMFT